MLVTYIARRLLQLIPTLLVISTVVFIVMYLLPGDFATLALTGQSAVSKEHIQQLREEMGLDDPVYVQYGRFLAGALRGDLGTSSRFRQPVTKVVVQQFPSTVRLSLAGMAVALLMGMGLGTIAGLYPHSFIDTVCMSFCLLGVSTPIFWSGLMSILLFAFSLDWLPATGTGSWRAMILPALTLGWTGAGAIGRLTRSLLIEVMSEDYITVARAKGLRERWVVSRHAMKNVLLPVVTMAGLRFGAMLSGAVVTETVFSRPGLGRLIVSAVLLQDFQLAQGAILLVAVSFMLVNLVVDVSYAYIDPRIRLS